MRAVKLYDDKSEKVKSINSELGVLRAGFYKVNLKYAEKKAKIDVLKFELESANLKDAKKAEKAEKNSNILCMLPDTAERYMSSILFENINTEMSVEELEVFNSTK